MKEKFYNTFAGRALLSALFNLILILIWGACIHFDKRFESCLAFCSCITIAVGMITEVVLTVLRVKRHNLAGMFGATIVGALGMALICLFVYWGTLIPAYL